MRYFKPAFGFLLLILLGCRTATAEPAFSQAGCSLDYPEAMALLQQSIAKQGYTISRIQPVDKGLRMRGYETGFYRVVFFGQPEQMASIRQHHPKLIPYLPLKITLLEDGEQNIATALQPASLSPFFEDEAIQQLLQKWQQDVTEILSNYDRCDETRG